ncbi:structural protein [Aeromicrobium fastidiosum]|uniref:Uncharacterized protein n=1 Tax=Aeromicrobium fastidiosum TaxID=52699 RepID=A0A641AJU6_9ACTN|nr:hypothetical protein [Aeromicrobium fastidiosum]KAA1376121.1 hypothetical protein ESP62_011795 [Aeromicrobium fastidiosum]MBP2391999.1 hypothetical protein [Aeromicrobium fastidiosum]
MTDQQQNAETVASKVGTLAAMYAAGVLTREAFVESFALVVYAAKVSAARIAEVALWRWSLTSWPEPIEPLGIVPDPDVMDSLREAVETIAEDEGAQPGLDADEFQARTISEISRGAVAFGSGVEIVQRSERVAADAARESGKETTQDRMERAGVTHWRWVAQPDACDECRKRHGRVYAIDVKFRDHPQCECSLEPATPQEIETSLRKRRIAATKEENRHDTAA